MAAYTRPIGAVGGNYNSATQDFVVNNGTTITLGDFVSFNSSGYAIPTTSGRILGTASGTVVGDGTKTVKVLVDPLTVYSVPTNGTLTQASVGEYFTLTGATGVQQVNTGSASASTGQLICIGFTGGVDPVRTNATYGQFVITQSSFAVA